MWPDAIRAIYPPSCLACGEPAERDYGLCGACWIRTPFLTGLVCDACGCGLPGEGRTNDGLLCDDCLRVARPWHKGRAAMSYRDNGRRFALQLKHGDRTDLARPLAAWMATAARPIVEGPMRVIPVPLHRSRLFLRRFNQAALLAQRVAAALGLDCIPDALVRRRRTPSLGGLSREERFRTLQDSIAANPARIDRFAGNGVLLVDDVMTTGATFAACTEALHAAGASRVCVLALARAGKDD